MAQERTYLELSEEAEDAHKFYEVIVDDRQVTIRFGRIGATGQVQVKQYADAKQAAAEAQKKISEKLRKGYSPAAPGTGGTLGALTPLTARLDAWLRRRRPKYHAQMSPGLDDQQLQAFEAALGLELPDGMRAFFRWRNGQALDCYTSLVHNFSLMNVETLIEERAALNEFLKSGEFDRANWWSTGWIPFLDNGGGDYYCLDTDGTFTGTKGQIIRYYHDYENRSVMAPDFDSWLETVVIQFEEDAVDIDQYGVHIEDSPNGFPRRFEAG